MRSLLFSLLLTMAAASGCSRTSAPVVHVNVIAGAQHPLEASPTDTPAATKTNDEIGAVTGGFRGFDRNDYPGDTIMQSFRSGDAPFAFTGYWITPPPGGKINTWTGKRALLKQQGWGFLVLANGRFDAEILKSQKNGVSADALGKKDAAVAIASARTEGFPTRTILFLDQEEGGRLLAEQAAYLLAWTEAVAASDYRPGVYASGQLVQDDPGVMIDTIRDIRARVKQGKLHEIAIFDAQDACPPAPGCTVHARPIAEAGEPNLTAWQYSQSPRRPSITKTCAATYAADGNCYAPGAPRVFLDMDLATSPDPSHGR